MPLKSTTNVFQGNLPINTEIPSVPINLCEQAEFPKVKKVTAVVIGAGQRGKVYSKYAVEHPEKLEIVGVAEPRTHARQYMMEKFKIKPEKCYENWTELCKEDRMSDCAIICTPDQQHMEPAVILAKKGYDILLEKPMAVTPEDCRRIWQICKEASVLLCVCHVLRYNPCVIKLKEIIDSGEIGDIVNINLTEPVGYWHFAHSFVRGNWRNTAESTFSLLSKCCHDVDLIAYWMDTQKCSSISSFGSLMHFRKENKPEGAGSRCLDCSIENTCAYSAKKLYLDPKPLQPIYPMSVVCDIENSPKGYLWSLTDELKKGPYGKCVYDTDNDVCDNQVVNFLFENGSTASLTMIAYTKEMCQRKAFIYGTKGELRWDNSQGNHIQHYDNFKNTTEIISCETSELASSFVSHGSSDYYIIKTFVDAVATNNREDITTGPKISLYSHLLTFAAEKSRLSGRVINLQEDPLFAEFD